MNAPIQNPEIQKLMAEIEAHRAKTGMSKTGFGVWAAKDPNLLRDLKAGRDLRWATIKSIREKMLKPEKASGGAA